MKNIIDMALDYDPIYEAEKISGKSHHSEFNNDDMMLAMGISMLSGETKKSILKEAGDTYFGIEWNVFIALIKSYGFKEALTYDFIDNQRGETKTEEAIIYYDDNGFVIWAESYGGKDCINSGKIYGQIEVNKDFDRCDVLSHCSNGYFSDNKVYFDKDIREGLINTINKVKKHSLPIKTWEHPSFLWFVDYMELKEDGYDYEQITKSKISKCPQEFQDIVLRYMGKVA